MNTKVPVSQHSVALRITIALNHGLLLQSETKLDQSLQGSRRLFDPFEEGLFIHPSFVTNFDTQQVSSNVLTLTVSKSSGQVEPVGHVIEQFATFVLGVVVSGGGKFFLETKHAFFPGKWGQWEPVPLKDLDECWADRLEEYWVMHEDVKPTPQSEPIGVPLKSILQDMEARHNTYTFGNLIEFTRRTDGTFKLCYLDIPTDPEKARKIRNMAEIIRSMLELGGDFESPKHTDFFDAIVRKILK